jgi:hypothetical protein
MSFPMAGDCPVYWYSVEELEDDVKLTLWPQVGSPNVFIISRLDAAIIGSAMVNHAVALLDADEAAQ